MSRIARGALASALTWTLVAALAGCGTTASTYSPRTTPPGELWFRYRGGVEVWNGPSKLTQAPSYEGLSQAVACVPQARRHADEASSSGRSAIALSWVAAGLAIVGLGGLSAFAVDDRGARIALLSSGLAVELIGLITSGLAYGRKAKADGHAMDAVNFYNDRAQEAGHGCSPAGP